MGNVLTLILMALLGFFAFECGNAYKNFRGSSTSFYTLLSIATTVGYTAFYVLTIWAMFKMVWWHPIVMLVLETILTGFIAGILAIFLNGSLVAKMIWQFVSVIGVFALTVISAIRLL